MIDPKKTYRTRDGREVRIYAVDGVAPYSVHGAIHLNDEWQSMVWRPDGTRSRNTRTTEDLIEVKPRIQREVWVNVYPNGVDDELYFTKEVADQQTLPRRIACVMLTIDCEEGEGL